VAQLLGTMALALLTASGTDGVSPERQSIGWTLLCPALKAEVTLDGNLAEWDMAHAPIRLDRAHAGPHLRAEPPVDSDRDLSARVALAWKGNSLYVAAAVTDDEPAGLGSRKAWGNPWEHDNLGLYLLPASGGVLTGRLPAKPGPLYPPFRGLFGLSYFASGEPARPVRGLTYAARRTADGYALEGRIDFSAFRWKLRAGDVFRLSIVLVDRDPSQSGPSHFSQWVWHMGTPQRGTQPEHWGQLRLMGPDGVGMDVACQDARIQSPATLPVGGTADVSRPNVVLKSVRLLDGTGRVLAESPMKLPLSAGRRTVYRTTLDVPALPPGTYEVQATAVADGRAVAGAAASVTVQPLSKPAAPSVPMSVPGRYYTDDPTRYRKPFLPLVPHKITRADYLKRARTNFEPTMHYPKSVFKRPDDDAYALGCCAAILYKATGQQRYADYAKAAWQSTIGWVREGKRFNFIYFGMLKIMVDVMKDTGLLTAKDEPVVRHVLETWGRRACWGMYEWKQRPWRRGAGHSALGPAVARGLAVHWYPDVKEADLWKRYFDLTFNDSWQHRDTIYNDTNYQPAWFFHMQMVGHLMNRPEVFTDPQARQLWQRYLDYMTPMGAHTNIGDGAGWNQEFHKYVFLFEMLARYTRDGRYKWAAHRLMDYAEQRIDGWDTNHLLHGYSAFFLAQAWLVADESILEAVPAPESRLLMRKELLPTVRTDLDFGHQIYRYRPGPATIPDKLILRSGNDPASLWAMVECCPTAGHNQPGDSTAIVTLVDRTSVLLADPTQRGWSMNHHRVQIEDLTGLASRREKETTTVPVFLDGKAATAAAVAVTNYAHLPVNVRRDILFVKDRLMLLRDTVTFQEPFLARFGPTFNHRNIGPQGGPTWTNSYVPNLHAYKGTLAWRNPVRDLLVYHAPRPGAQLRVTDMSAGDPAMANPLRVRYECRRLPTPNQTEEFTTLLLPHDPVIDVAAWVAKSVALVLNDPGQTAFRIVSGSRGESVELVLMSRDGKPVSAGDLETDAGSLYLLVYRGTPKRLFATGATFVKWKGKPVAERGDRGLLQK